MNLVISSNVLTIFLPLFTVILCNFYEGTHRETLTAFNGFEQLISIPTHILPNSSSCIDLIFTNQPNLIFDCGVHATLHPYCHHQIVYCKFNLNTEYFPPYERLEKVNSLNIRKSIEMVNWEAMFANKNFHEQANKINKVLMNVFSSFIPNKNVTFDEKDLSWMNEFVEREIKWKNDIYKI